MSKIFHQSQISGKSQSAFRSGKFLSTQNHLSQSRRFDTHQSHPSLTGGSLEFNSKVFLRISKPTKTLKTHSKNPKPEMKVPTEEECMLLMKEMGLEDNMKKHSILVAKMAEALGRELIKSGERIDMNLLRASGLLHDIDKKLTLNDGKNHGFTSERILIEKGYPEVAKIARKHRLETIFEDSEGLKTWEEKLVFYADKRLNDYTLVSLDERYDYLLKRYGATQEICQFILKTKPAVENLEQEIFSRIGRSPDELKAMIGKGEMDA
jgi:putative nucleotidyltransferase with HDIG domain